MALQAIENERRAAPWLENGTTIPSLPPMLQEVPTEPKAWTEWATKIRHFRTEIRRVAATDPELQRHLYRASADDPAFFLTIFGSIYEPRWKGGSPPGWRPWILYAFQVEMIRASQDVLKIRSGPERHMLVEKARDMGASWIFCGLAAHAWLFAPVVEIALVSREATLVDARGDHNSMFFKVRGVLGIEETTPDDMRLPAYIFPEGFNPNRHDKTMLLTHPSKPNQIKGETTTKNSGRGSRVSWRINDEAAFNKHYGAAKKGQFNTTDHIFSISSAGVDDGGVFKDECEEAMANATNPHVRTQTHMRLHWWMHPLHDDEWYRETKAEMGKTDPYAFDQEVLMNYTAGKGKRVYPDLSSVKPGPFPYVPGGGPVICAIDPGLSDATAILWVQYIVKTHRFRVVRGFQMPDVDAEYIASVLTGTFGGEMTDEGYRRYLAAKDTMVWIKTLRDPISYVGDPYGNHRGGDGKSTFYKTLAAKSSELTGGRHVIAVMADFDPEANTYRYRRDSVMMMLPMLDWHHDPDVTYALQMVQDAIYPDSTTRAVKEPDKPRHDKTSHYRSTIEYWAVERRLNNVIGDLDRKVEIVNLGGSEDTSIPPFARGMALDFDRDAPARDDRTLFEE